MRAGYAPDAEILAGDPSVSAEASRRYELQLEIKKLQEIVQERDAVIEEQQKQLEQATVVTTPAVVEGEGDAVAARRNSVMIRDLESDLDLCVIQKERAIAEAAETRRLLTLEQEKTRELEALREALDAEKTSSDELGSQLERERKARLDGEEAAQKRLAEMQRLLDEAAKEISSPSSEVSSLQVKVLDLLNEIKARDLTIAQQEKLNRQAHTELKLKELALVQKDEELERAMAAAAESARLERARQELTLLKKDSEVEHLKSSAVNAKEFDLKRSHYFELEAMYRSITIVMAPGLMQCLWVS